MKPIAAKERREHKEGKFSLRSLCSFVAVQLGGCWERLTNFKPRTMRTTRKGNSIRVNSRNSRRSPFAYFAASTAAFRMRGVGFIPLTIIPLTIPETATYLFFSNHAFASASSGLRSGRFCAMSHDSAHSLFRSPRSTVAPTRTKIGMWCKSDATLMLWPPTKTLVGFHASRH